ncbi:hypothetical protein TSUD_190340 [Trifolium subterraneum]|uniref:Uncharacterized protein n=1 Tax=Trifolium subterraneum TaxID=3900 RepID=A0A2Z6P228_TRISU|nr:hypothetical protein TSUD_190340 [Trifolium subterraneum]
MVLLRELDGAKDYPLVIHLVGSDWERQVRAYYTRADGTLNINGYYSEMFGFPSNSSDFESGNSDSDSDSSGNDSDCVIISPSEFSSKNHNNRSLIVADSVATISTSMEISSRFTNDEFVSTFRQLHPNSWAFLKAFQIACEWLDIVPTAGIFFSFFHAKNVSPHSLVSISSQPNKGRFSLYALNFKNYRDTFVRFLCREGFPELMFDASGDRLFPFYWSSAPRLIKGTQVDTLNEYERQAVATFSRFHVMSSGELIARENKPHFLWEYMSSMSTHSAQQRAALVLKARAQRAEAERTAASAYAMAQLVVEEGGVKGTKRKNQEESSWIPIEISKKKKQLITIEQEEEDADDQPLNFKRVPRGKGSLPPNSGEGGSNYARTSSLSELDCEDLRQVALDHHIQGVMLNYYLSSRQEMGIIEARNKMESADNGLSALEKEFAAAKSKFEEDLAAVKAGQEEVVKTAVKAKDDEVIALKERVKTLEGELDVAPRKRTRPPLSGTRHPLMFSLDQVKVAFPDVDVAKLGELDSANQIMDGKIVAYFPPVSE